MENQNTLKYLEKTKTSLFEYLRHVQPAPGIQYSIQAPRDVDIESHEELDPESRFSQQDLDRPHDEKEFFASEKDQDKTTAATKGVKPSGPPSGQSGMEVAD